MKHLKTYESFNKKYIDELINKIMILFTEFQDEKRDIFEYYNIVKELIKEYVDKYDLDLFEKSDIEYWDGQKNVNIIQSCRLTMLQDWKFQEYLVSKDERVVKYLIHITKNDDYVIISPEIEREYSYLFDSDDLGIL